MPEPLPRVAVVIVTYQSADVIAACLEGLAAAAEGVDLVSVVVADNASVDHSVDLARSVWPSVRIVPMGGNLGYSAAINAGRAASAPHDCLMILNPDTVMQPGAVRILADALASGECELAVPRMTEPDGALAFSQRRWPSLRTAAAEAVMGGPRAGRAGWGEVVSDPGRYARPGPVDWATGAAVMVDSSSADRLGPWDESFFLYSEETEYMIRAHRAGMRVRFVPDAVCQHRGGESGTSPRLWALLMTNKVRLYRRTHGRWQSAAFRAVLVVGQGARAVVGSKRSRAATAALLAPLTDTATAPAAPPGGPVSAAQP